MSCSNYLILTYEILGGAPREYKFVAVRVDEASYEESPMTSSTKTLSGEPCGSGQTALTLLDPVLRRDF